MAFHEYIDNCDLHQVKNICTVYQHVNEGLYGELFNGHNLPL